MNLGEAGTQLLMDLKSDTIKPFNTKAFDDINKEIVYLQEEMQKIKDLAETEEITIEMSLNYMMLKKYEERNIRVKKNYLYHRYNNNMNDTEKEKEYNKEYNKLYDEYFSEYNFIDLNLKDPPIDLFISILTLRDCGAVMVGDEIVDMKKDKIYFVKRSCVKHLIENNFVKII